MTHIIKTNIIHSSNMEEPIRAAHPLSAIQSQYSMSRV